MSFLLLIVPFIALEKQSGQARSSSFFREDEVDEEDDEEEDEVVVVLVEVTEDVVEDWPTG